MQGTHVHYTSTHDTHMVYIHNTVDTFTTHAHRTYAHMLRRTRHIHYTCRTHTIHSNTTCAYTTHAHTPHPEHNTQSSYMTRTHTTHITRDTPTHTPRAARDTPTHTPRTSHVTHPQVTQLQQKSLRSSGGASRHSCFLMHLGHTPGLSASHSELDPEGPRPTPQALPSGSSGHSPCAQLC